MKLRALLPVILGCVLGCGLTPAQDVNLVVTIAQAACAVAGAVPNDPSAVTFVCTAVDQTGTATKPFYVRVPTSQAAAFQAANPAPSASAVKR